MSNKLFTGVGVAIVTPFDEQGNIDIDSLKNLVSHIIDKGADFITVLGTTAETPTLSREERELVVKTVAEHNAGRLPLLVGVGGNCTANVINDLKNLSYFKYCQGVLSVVPYYNKPSQQGMYEHFKAVAEASPLPVVLYNVPGRTGANMCASTVMKLANDCPNIVGIKEASGLMQQATELLKITRPDFSILIYPVITLTPGTTHHGTHKNLLGEKNMVKEKYLDRYSLEKQACRFTPPTFLALSSDDATVPVENSLRYYNKLVDVAVPVEMHIWPTGGHGWGFSSEKFKGKGKDKFAYARAEFEASLERWLEALR